MRALTLRAQLLFVIAFLELYSIGVGVSYWIQHRAHESLVRSFHQDLAVLDKLPRLKDLLRKLDELTNQYLLTGNSSPLEERRKALSEIRFIEEDLTFLLADGREREIFREMDKMISSYLAQQSQWIGRKRAGRLPTVDATRITARGGAFEKVGELVTKLKDANVEALKARGELVRRAARLNLGLILATGILACALIAFFLSRYWVGPVTALERYARSWDLGRRWELAPPEASSEIRDLFACMQGMSERLNRQYASELELGQLKGRLVSMVSHEFNNALSTIQTVAILLKDTDAAPSQKREDYYKMLASNIRSLSLAAKNILEMGRLESGQFPVKPQRTELETLLKEGLKRLEVLYQRKHLEVSVDFPKKPIPVRADPEALTLVVTNLLSNAIKYTPEKGKIRVGFCANGVGEEVEVYFQDTGIGISPQDQRWIFESFYRTEKSKKTAPGFGLGLSLADSILSAHGSVLRVASEPGKGSRFSFNLPVWREDAAQLNLPK